jgi:signal peptidase I
VSGARTLLSWLLTIAAAVGIVLAFEAEVATPYRIPSSSMEPTIHCAKPQPGCEARFADRIIACRICYRWNDPARGQIVVFHAPARAATDCGEGGIYVKRLIGLPGDTVHEDGRSRIWVNGHELDERYVTPPARAADTRFRNTSWHVPRGRYFLLGDNRADSCDSRTWGTVPHRSLVGPVIATYWPPTRIDA